MAAGADARLRLDVDVDVDGEEELGQLGDKLAKTERDAHSLGNGTKKLTAEFDRASASVKKLRADFDRTGDTDLLPALAKAERNVKRLGGWMDHLGARTKASGDDTVRTTARISGAWGLLSASVAGSSNNMIKWLAKPQVLIAALGTVTVASAAAAGVALAGFGLGLIGLGAFALRGSKQVQNALHGLGETARVTLSAAAQGMEKPFVGALRRMEATVSDIGPDLRAMFDNVTPGIDAMSAGVDGLVRKSMPGLVSMSKGANDVLGDLGGHLPEMGAAISSLGDSMNDASEGGGKALVATLASLETGVRLIGNTMEFSAKGFDLWSKANPILADGLGVSDRAMKKAADSAKNLDSAVKASVPGFSSVAASANMSKAGVEALERANLNLARSFRDVSNAALAAAGTEIGAINARHAMTEELKDGTRSLNINTAAGRANKQAILDGVGAAVAYGQAEEKRTGSQLKGTQAQRRHTDAMYASAVAAGVDKKQIDALWRSLGLLPPAKATKVTTPGAPKAKVDIDKVTDAATRMPKARATAVTAPGAVKSKVDIDKVSDAATRMPRSKNTNITQRGGELAKRVIQDVVRAAFAMPSSRTINIITRRTTLTYTAPAGSLGSRIDRSALGNIYSFAGGGVQAKIAGPGTLYQWAEPATGGEAFIPRRGDMARSRSIAQQVVQEWLGGQVSWPSRSGGSPSSAGGGSPTVVELSFSDSRLAEFVDVRVNGRLQAAGRALSHGRR